MSPQNSRRPLFIANWKMNLSPTEVSEFISIFLEKIPSKVAADVAIAPQSPLLTLVREQLKNSPIVTAAQNSGTEASGAFTGEISPLLLKELGIQYALLGHSERRHVFGETDAIIASRWKAALKAELPVVLCVGETLQERRQGKMLERIHTQLGILPESKNEITAKNLVIAYEPVWAIGTGETATPEQAQEVHASIRKWMQEKLSAPLAQSIRIQYGGSVKAENAKALMRQPDIDGLLVGSASLKANSFAEIVLNGVGSMP